MTARVKAQIARRLPQNPFARAVSVLVGGTAASQLLMVLAAPLLTRLYTPDDFGVLAVYAGLLALIGVISSLRYELAIPLPEDDQEAAHVVVLSVGILLGMTALSALIVTFFGTPIANRLGVPVLADFFWLLPAGVFLSGAYQVFNYWAIRTKRFSTIAATKLRQSVTTLVIQLAGFKVGGIALLFGTAGGQGMGTITLGKHALVRPEYRNITLAGIKRSARRYRRFPMFSTWAGFVNTAGHQLPPLVFAALFSAGAAGLYALAHRVLSLPASLLGTAVGNVFFANAAEAHRSGRLAPLAANLYDKLSQIGMPPAMLLVATGPDLFAFVFGEEWRDAGVFSQWLAVSLYAAFVTSPLSMIFTVLEKQDTGLYLQAALFSLRLAAILLGAFSGDIMIAIALFSIGSFVGYLLYISIALHSSGVSQKTLIDSFTRSAVVSSLCVLPVLFYYVISSDGTYLVPVLVVSTLLILLRYISLFRTAGVKDNPA